MNTRQLEALQLIADGHGVVGAGAPHNNTCRALLRASLIEGRGWRSDPYRLTAAGDELLKSVASRQERG